MQTQGPENIYARMPFIEKLIEMGWKKEPDKISEPYKDYFKSLNEIRDKLSNSLYAVNKKYTV